MYHLQRFIFGGSSMSTNKSKPAGVDMSALFGAAAKALAANKDTLNKADVENHDHGDNMVQVFNMISQVMASQQGASPAEQLNTASQYLAQNGKSGSANVYSQGLAQAAHQFQGQSAVTPDNAMILIQALLGDGRTTSAQGSDLLGTLLGGQQSTQQGGNKQQSGIDLGDIVSAGLSFMNAKQQGQDNMQAALTALMSAGPMAQKPYRQQSGQVVANALLQVISGMANKR
jgi:hypothetical protein